MLLMDPGKLLRCPDSRARWECFVCFWPPDRNPEYPLEGLMLKHQYFGHLESGQRADSLEKTLMLGQIEHKKGVTENEVVGWHHWLSGHEFEQNQGDGEGQGSCSPWGHKESDMTRRLNSNNQTVRSATGSMADSPARWRLGSCRNTHWKDSEEQNLVAFIYIFKKIFIFFSVFNLLHYIFTISEEQIYTLVLLS